MMDWRNMFDSDFLHAWHLGGRERTLTITRVEAGAFDNRKQKKKEKKPFLYFRNVERPLGLNKTNCKTLASLFGNDTTKWAGQRVTVYPTRTQFGNDEVDCIRIRPTAPSAKTKDSEMPTDPTPPTPEEAAALERAVIDTQSPEREPGQEG